MPTTQSGSLTGTDANDRQIVAVYETYDRARSARDELTGAGIPASDIEILDAKESGWQSSSDTTSSEGFWGALKRLFAPDEDTHSYAEGLRRGHTVLAVRPSAEQHARAVDILEKTEPLDFDARVENWRNEGWNGRYDDEAWNRRAPAAPVAAGTAGVAGVAGAATGTAGAIGTTGMAARPMATPDAGNPDLASANLGEEDLSRTREAAPGSRGASEQRIPVVEETLRVGKREVAGGSVRVRSYVVERPVEEQVRLHEESVHVDRQAVDQPVSEAGDPFRERTIEVSARSEEAVIGKDARVREEVVVRKDASDRTETVKDTVRRTEVEVDDGRGTPKAGTGSTTTEKGTVKP